MRISDWSSDVCSSDLANRRVYFDWHPVLHLSEDQVFATIEAGGQKPHWAYAAGARRLSCLICIFSSEDDIRAAVSSSEKGARYARRVMAIEEKHNHTILPLRRSEEHTSELQSLMRNPYAVFCLKKKITLAPPSIHI